MTNPNYRLHLGNENGVWTAILAQRARTTVEIEDTDLRKLLKEITELIVFREESPLRARRAELIPLNGKKWS